MYRNLPLWHIPIELRRRMPNLPIFCDPSHIGGKRELIAPLSQQAMEPELRRPDDRIASLSGLVHGATLPADHPDVLDYVVNPAGYP